MVNGWKGQVIYGKLSASQKDWICGILAPFFIFIDDNRSLDPHLEIDSEGVIVATVKVSKWWLQLYQKEPLVQ
jgi:hypothetical protein